MQIIIISSCDVLGDIFLMHTCSAGRHRVCVAGSQRVALKLEIALVCLVFPRHTYVRAYVCVANHRAQAARHILIRDFLLSLQPLFL